MKFVICVYVKILQIILPALVVSLIGWIMVIVFFGKFDQENYKESGSEIR